MATAIAGLAPSPEVFTDEILRIIASATWPDGSALVGIADEVLCSRLAPQLLEASAAFSARTMTEGPR